MRDPNVPFLELDEIWRFIGKKEKHRRETDDPTLGDVWTFCAIDAETKVVPFRQSPSTHNRLTYSASYNATESRTSSDCWHL
jgi:hypothetical protein